MNRSFVAGVALIAGMTLAVPVIARSADETPQTAQSAPADPSAPAERSMGPGMRGGMGMGMHARDGSSKMGRHGEMRRKMRHRMAQMSPQERCEERLARRAARVAYTGTMLKLTAEQRPLWERVTANLQAARDQQLQLCATLQPADQQTERTVLDRVNRAEQYYNIRLQGLQQVRPALEQLYETLTEEQKAVIDRRRTLG
jgi:hypothetical protein